MPGPKGVSKGFRTSHWNLSYITKMVKTNIKMTIVTNSKSRQ